MPVDDASRYGSRAFFGEGIQSRDHGQFRVHFEEPAQVRAGFAAAETIRPERHQTTRHPWSDLVRHDLHVVRDVGEDSGLDEVSLGSVALKFVNVRFCSV